MQKESDNSQTPGSRSDGTTKRVTDILADFEGSEDIFELLLQAVEARIRRWAFFNLKDNSLETHLSVEDLEQTVKLRFLKSPIDLQQFEGDGRRFMKYLSTIVHNTICEKGKKYQRSRTHPNDDLTNVAAPEVEYEKFARLRSVSDAMLRLPEELSEAINLVYLEGHTRVQAASQLNLSKNQFHRRLDQAISELKALVELTDD